MIKEPTNLSKRCKDLHIVVQALLENCHDFELPFLTVTTFYLQNFDCSLNAKELNSELMKICRFNGLKVGILVKNDILIPTIVKRYLRQLA